MSFKMSFLQECVSMSVRRQLDCVALFAFSPTSTTEYIEKLKWIEKKFRREYARARFELTKDLQFGGVYNNYRRRTDAAVKQATDLWEQANGSVDSIESIMQTVSSDNHLKDNEVPIVERHVFGT